MKTKKSNIGLNALKKKRASFRTGGSSTYNYSNYYNTDNSTVGSIDQSQNTNETAEESPETGMSNPQAGVENVTTAAETQATDQTEQKDQDWTPKNQPDPERGWSYQRANNMGINTTYYWHHETGDYRPTKPDNWQNYANANPTEYDQDRQNPITGGDSGGGENPITGGGGTVADNKKSGLLDTEARQGRIEAYETDLASARKGTLTEDSKAQAAEKITDAGKGTKIAIAGTIPEGYSLLNPYLRSPTGSKDRSAGSSKQMPFDNSSPPAGYQWAYKGSDRIAVPLDQREAPDAAQAGKPTDEIVAQVTETSQASLDAEDAPSGQSYNAAEAGIPTGFSKNPNPKLGMSYSSELPSEGNIYIYDNKTGIRKQISDPAKATKAATFSDLTEEQKAEREATATGPTMTERAVAAERDTFQETLAKGTAAQRPTEEVRILSNEEAETEYKQSETGKNLYAVQAQEEQKYNDAEVSIRAEMDEAIANGEPPSVTRAISAKLNANLQNKLKMQEDFQLAVKEGIALTKQNAASGMKQYAEGVTTAQTQQVADVAGPAVMTSEGVTISKNDMTDLQIEADKRGVGVEELKEYQDLITVNKRVDIDTGKVKAEQATAATRIDPVTGQPISQALDVDKDLPGITEEDQAKASFKESAFSDKATGTTIETLPTYKKAATRTAQTAEAATRIARTLGEKPPLDLEGREAITGTAPQGTAAQIGGVPTFEAAKMNAVQGKERTVAAADMLAVVADIPEDVSAAISEDPATVQAQIDEGADPQVVAAVAALPQEALVSTQMEGLLAGMEDGQTPAWARPAVAAIEQQMAQRGLSASTVGRDALFNAIIQSALPIAQSNAQALQQRAQQNLSNEQQANLASAQNTMTVRMQNLANRQLSASQTATMAQEIKIQQGTFQQQAVITSAQQEQQAEMATFQAAQQKAQQESAQRQQAAISQLSANAQMDLANLQALNAAGTQNLNAEQQAKLQSYNAQINKIMRQADLNQDMEKANLSPALQVEMQRISEMNAAAKDSMTAEQQERLVSLQTLIDFRKTDAQFAQQMDMANMSNEQQIELAELQEKAATDSANFTAENQFELARLNAKVQRAVRQAELTNRMEEVNLDAKLKIELSELTEQNATARANMTAEQQTKLANLNVLVDFRKTNAAMAQQMDLANLGNEQQIELANLAERAAVDSANFTAEEKLRSQKLNNYVQVMSQDEQLKMQADLANLSMEEKISLANLSNQQQSDMASMSAENVAELQRYEKQMGAAQLNANLAQQMGLANLTNQQQASMFNAQIDANLDMKQFDANQQMALANSSFMQTMTIKNFDARQQEAMQNATALASMDLAAADQRTKLAITNAQNFLKRDMAGLNNEQQALMLDQQLSQQRLLSDQSAANIAAQFGAKSEQDVDLFMANIAKELELTNTAAENNMKQFNANATNAAEARDANRLSDYEKFNAGMKQDMSKFNEQARNNRDAFNAQNAAAVEAADIADKRRRNEIDTATTNAINMQNASNSFKLSTQSLAFLNQEMRDQADYEFKAYESSEARSASIVVAALGAADNTFDDSKWTTALRSNITTLLNLVG